MDLLTPDQEVANLLAQQSNSDKVIKWIDHDTINLVAPEDIAKLSNAALQLLTMMDKELDITKHWEKAKKLIIEKYMFTDIPEGMTTVGKALNNFKDLEGNVKITPENDLEFIKLSLHMSIPDALVIADRIYAKDPNDYHNLLITRIVGKRSLDERVKLISDPLTCAVIPGKLVEQIRAEALGTNLQLS